ncbi:MAG TPA: hypothetical protein VM935_03360 [Chitinophagaceae bacterium]|nr:hypothetical protein [Chitinophagaceae bacterium]
MSDLHMMNNKPHAPCYTWALFNDLINNQENDKPGKGNHKEEYSPHRIALSIISLHES